MMGFLIGAALAIALVLALLLRPFVHKTDRAQSSRRELNAAILREQLAKLEQDLADGTLGKEDYAQARAELQRRALEDTREKDATSTLRAPTKTIVGVSLLLPIAAGVLYLLIGNPASLAPRGAHQETAKAQELERMVATLTRKLEKEPGNLKGWAMLAQSYKAMGRMVEAEKAFERAGSFIDNDAQMLAIYAGVAAINNRGRLAGKPAMLIQKALKADPDNATALWLSGAADLEAGEYTQALRAWEGLAARLPSGSDDARKLQRAIQDVRAKAALAAKAPAVAEAAAAGRDVSGTVELDPSLKDKAGPDDTVMVIARLPGTRMPVAAVRLRAAELPVKFVLNDSQSMNPQSPISAATEVEVEARISKTGLAKAEPGDLISAVQTVKVGAGGVLLQVAQVRP
ncbi:MULTISPECIES: c-type cytochrome biogenesis protein CcmI [unclassified Variovorax]|uniref:c-type cytochrome biogenesis protein CcmI n=1 Tax=unclassified Variovorax TaxID=663243 RepID=UPI003ECE1128